MDVTWRNEHENDGNCRNAAVLRSGGQCIGSAGGHQPGHRSRNGRGRRGGARRSRSRACGGACGRSAGLGGWAAAGTLGAVGTVAGGLLGAPTYGGAPVGYVYNYCPAGYTPVTPPNTLPPNITGVGYCQAVTTPVAYAQPATRRVASVASRRTVSRLAYGASRRTMARRVASRTAASYRRVGFRTGR